MPATVLIGAQWGDEGKGKIIDVLTEESDLIVRFQGGNNAGHTVEFDGNKYILHLVPSGILRSSKRCVIGHGVVVDPLGLVSELNELHEKNVDTKGRLTISERAHLVFPYHRTLDAYRERPGSEGRKIGTTKRGIGPAYGDKALRTGMRMADLLQPDFKEQLAGHMERQNRLLEDAGAEPIEVTMQMEAYLAAAEQLTPYIGDTITLLNQALDEEQHVLFEGAQGTMLDMDCGTYPFVTSSSTTAGGACTGTGVPPNRIGKVWGVVKAYTTRVGEGPFPTELTDEVGDALRGQGKEFGATTGRPRRCGWFDGVVARYAVMVNGIQAWAVTKLDVLDHLDTVKLCTSYTCRGKPVERMPAYTPLLGECVPVYEEWEGWNCDTSGSKSRKELPAPARAYLDRIEEFTRVPVEMVSVGPGREQTIFTTGMLGLASALAR